ncbi:MAG: nitroreductase [Oscillospiraceae bacterium]|nr:nitroreductase [Oscillospiraceae bacterium]
MDIMELMRERHSVRQYLNKPIPEDIRNALNDCCRSLNAESGLNMQIIYDEPECFNSALARYGHFENANNYIALIGKKAPGLDERCGFFGEMLVLKAQELGLNTCWAALTHGKSKANIGRNEKEVIIISLGYGKTAGKERKSKSLSEVSDLRADSPEWYKRGIEAALMAPTAINQQKFSFSRNGSEVSAKAALFGPELKVDLGIVKCHFELAAGKENFSWK